ncbi:MAG: aldose epimerase family protein [Rikenellaceae bacterium]
MSKIKSYTLKNGGIEMLVTNFGGRVMKLLVADRNGVVGDVALGYNTTDEYLNNKGERYLGAACGRYANRIAKGHFTIDGVEYTLPINNNGQSLHGGEGIDSIAWDVVSVSDTRIEFRLISPDGYEGYPGELTIDMSYELTDEGEFVIDYKAVTTKKTYINLTHHSYFNLAGEGRGVASNHVLQIMADGFVPVNEVSIPYGHVEAVEGTPFDFRQPKVVDRDQAAEYKYLNAATGYDHCWVVNGEVGECRLAAVVSDPQSGRRMSVYTDQPGVQFYNGHFFDGKTTSKDGAGCYLSRGGFALETQNFPDAPNNPNFPSALLTPEQVYTHRCIYKFDAN